MMYSAKVLALCIALIHQSSAFVVPGGAQRQATAARAASLPGDTSDVSGALSDIFDVSAPVKLQGDTLRTWDIENVATERVQLSMKGDGRPMHANVELWLSPTYIPMQMKVYSEDGAVRPVNMVIETAKTVPYTVSVKNVAAQEFPFQAAVADTGLGSPYQLLSATSSPRLVQGAGAVYSVPLDQSVESVQILLKTEERNMKARIELTQGPNNVKQQIDLYSSTAKNPFYIVMETPGAGNVVRIINENTVEFPFDAFVQPFKVGASVDPLQPVVGGI